MADLIEYKCPCCGGKVEFNAGTQQMQCPYCDSEFTIESLKAADEALNDAGTEQMQWDTPDSTFSDEESAGLNVYSCQSCGGQIIADQTTAATHCPYCDNPIVMTGQFRGDLKPDFVIPFKLDKDAAVKALSAHFEGKRLLPKVFRDQHKIDEIKGVYVPVWLYDAHANGHITFKAHKTRRWSDAQFDYEEKSFYSAVRGGEMDFEKVPVDGSTKMDDELLGSIEPFDFKAAVPFQTAYLSGYLADKYDISAEDSTETANKRIKRSVEQAFQNTVKGYDAVEVDKSTVRLRNAKAKYALYPVWLLNLSWNNEKYTFAMNGQTGKFVGNLPLDKGAAAGWFVGIAAAVTAIGTLIGYLIS